MNGVTEFQCFTKSQQAIVCQVSKELDDRCNVLFAACKSEDLPSKFKKVSFYVKGFARQFFEQTDSEFETSLRGKIRAETGMFRLNDKDVPRSVEEKISEYRQKVDKGCFGVLVKRYPAFNHVANVPNRGFITEKCNDFINDCFEEIKNSHGDTYICVEAFEGFLKEEIKRRDKNKLNIELLAYAFDNQVFQNSIEVTGFRTAIVDETKNIVQRLMFRFGDEKNEVLKETIANFMEKCSLDLQSEFEENGNKFHEFVPELERKVDENYASLEQEIQQKLEREASESFMPNPEAFSDAAKGKKGASPRRKKGASPRRKKGASPTSRAKAGRAKAKASVCAQGSAFTDSNPEEATLGQSLCQNVLEKIGDLKLALPEKRDDTLAGKLADLTSKIETIKGNIDQKKYTNALDVLMKEVRPQELDSDPNSSLCRAMESLEGWLIRQWGKFDIN